MYILASNVVQHYDNLFTFYIVYLLTSAHQPPGLLNSKNEKSIAIAGPHSELVRPPD